MRSWTRSTCKFVDQVYGVKIPKQADVVIASCGGYPKDINVYQMQKTMDNAVLACREGGVVILLAECEEGSGSAVLEETCKRLGSQQSLCRDPSLQESPLYFSDRLRPSDGERHAL